MRTLNQISVVSLATLAIASSATACPFCEVQTQGLFIGETVMMGSGTARSWANIGDKGMPIALGVTMSRLAFENLPHKGKYGMEPEFMMAMPSAANLAPFDHVAIDWCPKGHAPTGIYDKPHFDFHFYTVPATTRSLMTTDARSMARAKRQPAPGFMPASYGMIPEAPIAYMGAHWGSMSFPELHGKPFTSTLIFGTFDAKLAFIEPMVTLDFLQSKPNFTAAIPLPAKVARAAFYPTEYRVSYDAKREEYTVAFQKFVWRKKDTSGKAIARR